jgi:Flp pilus assembly protein TadG
MATQSILTRFRAQVICYLRNRSGAVLVEFAMVIPIVLLLLFSQIAFGTILLMNDSMYDAARQAARELAVGTVDEAGAVTKANTLLASWPTTFNVTAQDTATTGTNDVRVQIALPLSTFYMTDFIPGLANLNATVVMRKE